MPELPEVETIRRELEARVVGRTMTEAWAFAHPKFTPALRATGTSVSGLSRQGKYLLFKLTDTRGPGGSASGGSELIVHLGMTGSLLVRGASDDLLDPYVRAWWCLGPGDLGGYRRNGADPPGDEWLVFRDVRRFGRLQFAEDHEYVGTLASQGPDALDPAVTGDELWQRLQASTRAVKTQLLTQRPLAGVGNIYADEALWLAGIHPRRRRLSRPRAHELLDALRDVLHAGIANGGTTLRDYRTATGAIGRNQGCLACYGRSGEPCLRCGTTLRRIVLDARSTTYCPACQT